MRLATRTWTFLATLVLIATLSVGITGCGKPELEQIRVTPEKKTLAVGETVSFQSAGLSGKGEEISETTFQWRVEGDAGSVDGSGQFTAKKPGSAEVIATANGISGKAKVTVTPRAVAKIEARADPASAVVGSQVKVTVRALSADGKPAGFNEVSVSSPTEGAKVSAAKLKLENKGEAQFEVTLSNRPGGNDLVFKSGKATGELSVEGTKVPVAKIEAKAETTHALAGTALPITVRALSADGKPAGFNEISVSSPTDGAKVSAETLALDEAGEGNLEVTLSDRPGENTFAFRIGGVSAEVRVEATGVSRLAISPAENRFEVGQEVTFKASGADEHGNKRPVEATWSLTGDSAMIREGSTVVMERPGEGILLAEYEGAKQGQPFVVVPGRIARIALSPESAQVAAGESVVFSAKAFNAQDRPLSADIEWSVTGEIGSVAPDGTFHARTVGTGAVVATSGDVKATVSVEVAHGPLADLVIEIGTEKLKAGEPIDLVAQGVDAYGNRFPVDPQWFLGKSLGKIDQEKATFEPVYPGTGEIRAMVGNVMKGATIEVVPAELARLQINPTSVDIIAGETVRFEVTGHDRFGNPIPVTPGFSIREALGELSPSGELAARKAGSTVVEARVDDFTVESSVAIAPAEMVRAAVLPEGPVELVAGTTLEFRAFGEDAFGNTVKSSVRWEVYPQLGSMDESNVLLPKKVGKGEVVATVIQYRTSVALEIRVPISVAPGETTVIQVEPESFEIVAGEEKRLSATAFDNFGNETGVTLAWSIKGPSLGTISAQGLFRAVKAGAAKLLAGHGNVSSGADVTVKPAEIAFLKTIPEEISLEAGEKVGLKAVGEDRFGNVIDADILWSFSDESLGTVAADEVLVARKVGKGYLVATSGVIVDVTPLEVRKGGLSFIEVSPAEAVVSSGQSVSFEARGSDAGENTIEIDPEWSVDERLGAVGKDGVFTADKVGEGAVTVVSNGVNGTAKVKVVPAAPASIEIRPEEITITAGEVTTPSFRVFDANGNEIPKPVYAWRVEGGVGFVDAENRFHAREAGTGALALFCGDAQVQIPVTVETGDVHTIDVQPAKFELASGESQAFSAKGFDSQGNRVDLEAVWSVGGGIGAIDDTGLFQASRVGNGYVTARTGDVAGMALVSVHPGPVATVVVEPAMTTARAGKTVGFAAVALDAQGNAVPTEFQWTIEPDGQIGELNELGGFTAMAAGEGTVTAAAGGVSGSAKVRVEAGTIRAIVLDPKKIAFKAGATVQFTAMGEDDYGNRVPLDASFSVHPPELGTVTADGLLTAQRVGSGAVAAEALRLKGSAEVEVETGELSRLVIRLPDEAILAGESYPFQAVGYDRGGNSIPVQPEWGVTQNIGKIEQQAGMFHAAKAGKGLVVAYSGGVSAQAEVAVQPGRLYSLFIEPNPVTVKANAVQAFEVKGFDVKENQVPISVSGLNWGVLGGVGVFENAGIFRGTSMGRGKVTAGVDDLIAEAYVTVIPGEPDAANSRVRVTHPTLAADGSAFSEIILEVRDFYDNPVPGVKVTLVASRQGDIVVQPPETDERGRARGRISSAQAGTTTVNAVVRGLTFVDTAEVRFE